MHQKTFRQKHDEKEMLAKECMNKGKSDDLIEGNGKVCETNRKFPIAATSKAADKNCLCHRKKCHQVYLLREIGRRITVAWR